MYVRIIKAIRGWSAIGINKIHNLWRKVGDGVTGAPLGLDVRDFDVLDTVREDNKNA